ncbi:hypothetical protein ACFL0V_06825 [Nanoarchaeota archaeon]
MIKFNFGPVQILAVILAGVMVTNFVVHVMRRTNTTSFWIITGICGAMAVWGIPWLREKTSKN